MTTHKIWRAIAMCLALAGLSLGCKAASDAGGAGGDNGGAGAGGDNGGNGGGNGGAGAGGNAGGAGGDSGSPDAAAPADAAETPTDAARTLKTDDAGRPRMNFFVTSQGNPKGGDFGGLAGADKFCQDLAAAVGHGDRVWRAYLSVFDSDPVKRVGARQRIGEAGPWINQRGTLIGSSTYALHNNGIPATNIVDEKGVRPPAIEHDILTGANRYTGAVDQLPECEQIEPGKYDCTCRGWTSAATTSSAVVGRSDTGLPQRWNHIDEGPAYIRGCDPASLRARGSGARIYCFAVD